MSIRLEELLRRLPSDTQERVVRAHKRFNNSARELLRQETGLKLNRDAHASPGDAVTVPVALAPGLPTVLQQKAPLPDDARRVALLAPHAQVLRDLRDGCARLVEKNSEWRVDHLVGDMLQRNMDSILGTKTVAELLLIEAERLNLVKWILEVDEDVLGVYRYSPAAHSGREGIELYWGIIGLIASWLALPAEDLTVVVLTHELAHAYTHLGLDIDGHRWPRTSFGASDHAVKEGLAQYYTVRVLAKMQAAGNGPMEAYDRLLPNQPPAYQVHVKWLRDRTPEMVRAAMLQIRRMEQPSLPDLEHSLEEAKGRLARSSNR